MLAMANQAKLRETIAETLWEQVSAHDLPHLCDALGMPKAPGDVRAFDSKRRYVRQRLMGLSAAELADMARAVAEQFDDPNLLALVSPAELRGVEGELKNLIFAANGPKPRIVLRDAINNVIEIIEHADACLVYDRPLHAGLPWGDLVGWWTETHRPPASTRPGRCTRDSERLLGARSNRCCSAPTAACTARRTATRSRRCSRRCTCTTTRTR